MIISSERKSRSPISRLIAVFWGDSNKRPVIVLTQELFRFELEKERSRIERRKSGEFAVVSFSGISKLPEDALDELSVTFADRIRITDSIGWQPGMLVVLLPETNREGACVVANSLVKIGLEHDCDLETEILVFPQDDEISSGSDEIVDFLSNSGDLFGRGNDFGKKRIGETASDSKSFCRPTSESTDSGSIAIKADVASKNVGDLPFDLIHPTPWWKRATDLVGAVAGVVLLSPVFVGAAVAIKLTSKGPVFFQQAREGKGGKTFYINKFRTMRTDAESLQNDLRVDSEQDGPAFKLTNDPRVTSIGSYLRKSCIDELPQLVNVIRGEMSLVGPRPLPVQESSACKIWQRRRLQVLPGLTCIWQVVGGRQTRFDDWMRMDMEYLEKKGFWFDLGLIIRTAFVAVMHRGSV